jgi:hypothetical protein
MVRISKKLEGSPSHIKAMLAGNQFTSETRINGSAGMIYLLRLACSEKRQQK